MPTTTTSFTVTQQTLNIIRQLLNAKGWPETLGEAYIGGKLVTKYLPELDPIDGWVKTEEQLKALDAAELAAYRKRDDEWATKPVVLELTEKQVAAVVKAFRFFVAELLNAKQLGAAPFLTEIVDVFGLEMDE